MNLVCTNTTRFIIPMLFQSSTFDKILNKSFIDSYSFDYYELTYDNKIIIVKNKEEFPEGTIIPIALYRRQNHYCFVYDIPKEFIVDYNNILQGKYHLLSKKYYDTISNFWQEDLITTIKYNFIYEIYRVCQQNKGL